jgi:hypothetical protein
MFLVSDGLLVANTMHHNPSQAIMLDHRNIAMLKMGPFD